MRRASLFMIVLAASASGCGGCDDDTGGGADTDWISDGSGVENAEPLLPLRPGTRGQASGAAFADAVIDDRLLRIQLLSHVINASTNTYDELLVGQGADGIELHGSEANRLARPVLIVPDVVRVGMRWRANVPGQPSTELEVTARREESTMLGPGVIWTIAEYADGSDEPIATLELQEGVGIYATDIATLQPQSLVLDATLDDAPVPPALPTSPLTSFTVGGADYGENLALMHVGLVVPAGAGRGTLIVKGWRSCIFGSDDGSGQCLEQACFTIDSSGAIGQDAPRVEAFHQGTGCVQHLIGSKLELTSDAGGAAVLPSGVYWLPRSKTGAFRGGAITAYADPATLEPRVLANSVSGYTAQQRATWAPYVPDATSYANVDAPLIGQWVSPLFEPSFVGYSGDYLPYQSATLSSPGEPLELALIGGHNTLYYSRLDGDVLSPLEHVTTLAGAPSFTSTENGQELLVSSPGGRIDRIVRDPDSALAREAIGRVALPRGEFLVAAVDLEALAPGRLLVATWKPPAPDNTDVQGNFGRVSFYTTDKQSALRWDWPVGGGVLTRQISQDVIVCWPTTDAPLSRDGWTIGGIAAKQVLETVPGRCARIVRDVDADPVFAGKTLLGISHDEAAVRFRDLRFDVEGPVPGIGRMRLGVAPNTSDVVTMAEGVSAMAPLANGGYARLSRLVGAGGREVAIPLYPVFEDGGTPDLAGAGMWSAKNGTAVLVGPTSRTFTLTSAAAPASIADPNGGLLVTDGGGWKHLAADGTVTPMPSPPGGTNWSVRRRSGELCTAEGADLMCANTAGTEVARTTVSDFVGIVGLLGDDSMLVSVRAQDQTTSLYRWVPGSAPAPWDDRELHSLTPALDGTPWCVLRDDEPQAYAVGHCTPSGFVPVDLMTPIETRSWFAANYFRDIYSVIQGQDELWVETFGCLNGCYSRWTRLPWPL